jgi:hypothetical protein
VELLGSGEALRGFVGRSIGALAEGVLSWRSAAPALTAEILLSLGWWFERMAIHMLGEMIGELTGNVVGKRISHHYGGDLKIERTMESKGVILGTKVTLIATFWSTERPQGGMLAKGHGIMTTEKGETAVLQGSGISVPTKGPGWSMRGVRYLQTSGTALSRLNNVALLFEIEIAPDGTVSDRMWEWK